VIHKQNLFVNWKDEFVNDRSNFMDVLIVFVSLLAIPLQNVSGLSNVRIIRILRTVRVFHKIESMRLILTALSAAVVPVASAFFLMFLFTSIYAVLAVELFSSKSEVLIPPPLLLFLSSIRSCIFAIASFPVFFLSFILSSIHSLWRMDGNKNVVFLSILQRASWMSRAVW